jgi:CubicO group peptidase (beta-lactamase class C family)
MALAALLAIGARAHADPIDDAVKAEMQRRQIPGLSLAIIDGGKVVRATGYGVVEAGGASITATTLFQAGSISKAVAAFAVLHLVEAGKLALDDDVNGKLVGWKVPETELTRTKKVTLRRILSHTAGLTVHGFPGYAVGDKVPAIVDILDGKPPANTEAIRVDLAPDSKWRYSGGGYTIMQKLVVDVTGTAFPKLMADIVLGPAGMTHSSYEQPLPADRAKLTASAHESDRTPVPNRWHIYPEMAAAGLWTTPSDLVAFALEVQRAYAGTSKVMSAAMAKQMLTVVKDGDGLGVFLEGSGKTLRFSHDGRDEGFDALLVGFAETGQGAAIMINANDNSGAMRRLLAAIGKQYRWPGADRTPALPKPYDDVDPRDLEHYAGHYELAENQLISFAVHDGHLYTISDDLPDSELVPTAEDHRFTDGAMAFHFVVDGKQQVRGVEWTRGASGHGTAPRISPPIHAFAPHTVDPDPALTTKIAVALLAIAAGKPDPTLTAGLAHDIGRGFPALVGLTSLAYIAGWRLDTPIPRHGGRVDRIVVYRRTPEIKPRYVLAYLTADGKLTDFDLLTD